MDARVRGHPERDHHGLAGERRQVAALREERAGLTVERGPEWPLHLIRAGDRLVALATVGRDLDVAVVEPFLQAPIGVEGELRRPGRDVDLPHDRSIEVVLRPGVQRRVPRLVGRVGIHRPLQGLRRQLGHAGEGDALDPLRAQEPSGTVASPDEVGSVRRGTGGAVRLVGVPVDGRVQRGYLEVGGVPTSEVGPVIQHAVEGRHGRPRVDHRGDARRRPPDRGATTGSRTRAGRPDGSHP